MTPLQLIHLLTEKMVETNGADYTVELRHDNELIVFDHNGTMVGESIVLEQGPKR